MNTTRLAASVFAISAIVGFGLAAHAVGTADEKAQEFVVCKSSKAVRTLAITPDSKGSSSTCKVTYTKSGVPETVGAHTTNSSCHSILDHVKEHLESSKWNCKEVSATVTTSGEVSRQ